MKKILIPLASAILLFGALHLIQADEPSAPVRFEYCTIRWGGRDNTCIIRPNGKPDFIGSKLFRISRPDRVDERAFYLSLTMNALGKEGYEFAGAINNDEIVMKRIARESAETKANE